MSVGLGYVLCLSFTVICVLLLMGWIKEQLKEQDQVRDIQRRDILNDLNSVSKDLRRILDRLNKLEQRACGGVSQLPRFPLLPEHLRLLSIRTLWTVL